MISGNKVNITFLTFRCDHLRDPGALLSVEDLCAKWEKLADTSRCLARDEGREVPAPVVCAVDGFSVSRPGVGGCFPSKDVLFVGMSHALLWG